MKNIIAAAVLLTALSTATVVNAENFNNTTAKLTVNTENYTLSVKSPKTGSTGFSIGTGIGPVDATATYFRDGNTNDFQLKVGKELTVPTIPVYIGASLKYDFGESSDNNSLTSTPYIGVSHSFNKITPFAEIGYSWRVTDDSYTDVDAYSSYLEVGTSYAISDRTSLKLSLVDSKDDTFKNGDKEFLMGLTISF